MPDRVPMTPRGKRMLQEELKKSERSSGPKTLKTSKKPCPTETCGKTPSITRRKKSRPFSRVSSVSWRALLPCPT